MGTNLAVDAPALFDPRNPLLALEPSTAAFDEVVELLADPSTADIWEATDVLGWVYQFFNERTIRTTAAPTDSNDLAIRNQFFTPRYVVDYLVQNTLGRRLLDADPTSSLSSDLDLLVDPPGPGGSPLDLDDVCVLDPACGSGHFLLGCYDLLERAWESRGVGPDLAAPRIVSVSGASTSIRGAYKSHLRRSCCEPGGTVVGLPFRLQIRYGSTGAEGSGSGRTACCP